MRVTQCVLCHAKQKQRKRITRINILTSFLEHSKKGNLMKLSTLPKFVYLHQKTAKVTSVSHITPMRGVGGQGWTTVAWSLKELEVNSIPIVASNGKNCLGTSHETRLRHSSSLNHHCTNTDTQQIATL